MSGVLWGLFGAILIGVSDCVARVTAQRVTMPLLLFLIMATSLSTLLVWMAATGDWPPWHAYAWTVSAISGFLNLIALVFLYRALARGPVTVASPAASSFAVILIGLNALAGEPYAIGQIGAGLLVFLGVVMLARADPAGEHKAEYDAQWLRITAALALGCAASIALRMYLAQEATEILGPLHALMLNRVFAVSGIVLVLGWWLLKRAQLTWPKGTTWRLVAIQAVLEMAALGIFLIGSEQGRIGATIGFAAFSAVTALTAWIWLKEPIGTRRSLWMAVVAVGVALAVLLAPA